MHNTIISLNKANLPKLIQKSSKWRPDHNSQAIEKLHKRYNGRNPIRKVAAAYRERLSHGTAQSGHAPTQNAHDKVDGPVRTVLEKAEKNLAAAAQKEATHEQEFDSDGVNVLAEDGRQEQEGELEDAEDEADLLELY